MGNNSSNLQAQSVLSVSQPRLISTTSQQLLLQANSQMPRPKSDTDLLSGVEANLPQQQLARPQRLPRPQFTKMPLSQQIIRKSSSRRPIRSSCKSHSTSLTRQRSVRQARLSFKNQGVIRRATTHGADKRMAQEQKELYVAAARGDLSAVETIVDSGNDVNSADENHQAALHFAAMHCRDEVILSLIERGADVNATDLKGGFTALHWVAINADPQLGKTDHISKSLIALVNGGCNVNGTDFNFATPLHIAAQKGNKACIDTLLKLGADPERVDVTGRSCVDIAKNEEIKDFIKKQQKLKPTPQVTPSTRVEKKPTTHFYHVLEVTPPPTSSPSPPPSSTPQPPPLRRRRRQYVQYDMLDTHIYHVLESPPIVTKSSLPRRRKEISTRKNTHIRNA